jgi:hypothetical protein
MKPVVATQKRVGVAAIALAALFLTFFLIQSSQAMGWTSNFCGGTLTGNPSLGSHCEGAGRTLYAEEAWGEDHAVCATYTTGLTVANAACSSGPWVHAYHNFGFSFYTNPGIHNRGATSNRVHGVAYQP